MGKLFGTDGVRGIVLKELNIDLAMKIGAATAKVLKKKKADLTFLVGCDTRISKDILKHALVSGVLSENANIIDLGVIPTPAISYLIKKYHADGGFVISASHNPSVYNGIKVFDANGYKLSDELELEIEDIILNNFVLSNLPNQVGTYHFEENAKKDYVDFLKSTITSDLSKIKVGIDAANGAAFSTVKMLFQDLKVDYKIINDQPDGWNINKDAGSTHIENLQKFVVAEKLDCGIAFDGDADRLIMVDHLGEVIDGDKILAICGKFLHDQQKLQNNTIVGTVMSNLGLVKFCEQENINFVTTKVGDRYVLENMMLNNYILGGEQSGHIIFKELACTGDGELTCLQILNIMACSNKSLHALGSIMEIYPQVLKNVAVSKEGKMSYQNNPQINAAIKDANEKMAGNGRVLVRASGTENLIRVMLEGKDLEQITKICDTIVEVIEKELAF